MCAAARRERRGFRTDGLRGPPLPVSAEKYSPGGDK